MEALGRIASGIAHDLNNLLTVILGHAELLEMMLPAGSSARGLLTGIQCAAETAADMTSQMLALARQQPIPPEPLDVNKVVRDLVGLLRRVFDSRIEFEIETGPVPVIHAVPCQVTQVLLNLFLNARDAMPHGGTLTVRTELVSLTAGTFARLMVADTGGGIPEELLPRIFDPFFTTRPGQGTGLGLAMVQQIARLHKGWVECRSELGRGSSFDVYLPLAPASEAA
jgi:signal transduction histidine kinase